MKNKFGTKFIASISMLYLLGCTANNEVLLRWNTNDEGVQVYRTSIQQKVPNTQKVEVDFKSLLEKPILADHEINQLKSMEIKTENLPLLTTMSYLGDQAHKVTMQYKIDHFVTKPNSEEENSAREMMKAMEGIYELDTTVNSPGDNLSFYLKRNQNNLISIFFQLANKKLQPGGWWTAPMTITTLGSGHVAEEIKRVNRITLNSVYDSKEYGRIGVITYVILEYVKGNIDFRPNPEEGTPPFEYKSSYIAYGEFLIDKGAWKRYVGQMSIQGTGKKTIDTTMLFAMIPVTLQ